MLRFCFIYFEEKNIIYFPPQLRYIDIKIFELYVLETALKGCSYKALDLFF